MKIVLPVVYGALLVTLTLSALACGEPEASVQTHGQLRSDEMVYIAPATFLMGTSSDYEGDHDPDEQPLRKVTLTRGYWLGKYPVTNAQYARFLEAVKQAGSDKAWAHPKQQAGKDHTPEFWNDKRYNQPDQPVVGVDWYDAWAYANWAGGRLPTEAEWEYACRGQDGKLYHWGDGWPPSKAVGNFADETFIEQNPAEPYGIDGYRDGYAWTNPVGALSAARTWCGAMDMTGNVWEWCNDNYAPGSELKTVDPTGPESAEGKVVKGGSFRGEYAEDFRCAFRDNYRPDVRQDDFGFRVAVSAETVSHWKPRTNE
ncbi:MAG: formylglycine-generating enzyme family protein [Phycisphaerae bacterium]